MVGVIMALPVYISYCVVQTTIVVGIFVRGESSSSPYRVEYVKGEGSMINSLS